MISAKSLCGLLAVNVLSCIVTFYCYFKPFYIMSVFHNFLCFGSFSSFTSGDLYLCDVWETYKPLMICRRCKEADFSESLCLKIPWTLCMPETYVDASGELSSGPSIACRYSYGSVPSWVVARTEPFIYHNTNFHGGFVINCINVEKDEFWGDFCFLPFSLYFICIILFFWWFVNCCIGDMQSVFKGVLVLGLKNGRLF